MDKIIAAVRIAVNLVPLLLLAMSLRSRPLVWWWALACLFFDWLTLAMRWADLPFGWPGNIFSLVEFVMVSIYYLRACGWLAWMLYGAVVVFILLISYILFTGIDTLGLPGVAVLSLVYMMYALYGFYTLLQMTPTLYPERSDLFWVSCALLVHAGPTCIFFLFYDDVTGPDREKRIYWWSFFQLMNIIKYGLMAMALWSLKKKRIA